MVYRSETGQVGSFLPPPKRSDVTFGEAAFQPQSKWSGVGFGGRVTDVDLSRYAAWAAFNGNPVMIGSNRGPYGIGTALTYRPTTSTLTGSKITAIQCVASDGVHQSPPGKQQWTSAEDLADHFLQQIRDPYFRVIQFGNTHQGMVYSSFHTWSIQYTVPVEPRLQTLPLDGDAAARLANHVPRYPPGRTPLSFLPYQVPYKTGSWFQGRY